MKRTEESLQVNDCNYKPACKGVLRGRSLRYALETRDTGQGRTIDRAKEG